MRGFEVVQHLTDHFRRDGAAGRELVFRVQMNRNTTRDYQPLGIIDEEGKVVMLLMEVEGQ